MARYKYLFIDSFNNSLLRSHYELGPIIGAGGRQINKTDIISDLTELIWSRGTVWGVLGAWSMGKEE